VSKAIVQRVRDEKFGLWQTIAAENEAQTALRDTADYREGFAAFHEKRKPTFTGR
jgi:enoyl-CoA hydratase/carnithine racemase